MAQWTCGNLGEAVCQQRAAVPSGPVIILCIHNACSQWTRWLLFIWRLSINGKLQIAFEHLHAAHVGLDIRFNESHMSPVWMVWPKWSCLPVKCFHTSHSIMTRVLMWAAPGEPRGRGDCHCEGRGGRGMAGRDGEWNSQLIGNVSVLRREQRTWLIRYGPVHLRHHAAC